MKQSTQSTNGTVLTGAEILNFSLKRYEVSTFQVAKQLFRVKRPWSAARPAIAESFFCPKPNNVSLQLLQIRFIFAQ